MVHIIKVSDILKKQNKKDKKFRITDKGIQIFEFCGMSHTADVIAMMNVSEMNPAGNTESKTAADIIEANKGVAPEPNLVFVTVEGKAKRVAAAQFDTSRKTAQAMKANVVYVNYEGEYVVAETENGYSIKVRTEELPVQGKGAGGVTLISLRRGDHVSSAITGGNDAEKSGIMLSDMKAVKRGGKGNKKGK
jgi:DNA gyrase subunit A